MVRQITQDGSKSIVFDLCNVQFMNSSGLGMLVSSLTTLRKQGVGLKLASVPDKVTSLLEMTQLTQIFDIYPTVSDAVGPK